MNGLMTSQKFARMAIAGLIAATVAAAPAVAGLIAGSGIAHADDDAVLPIVEDLGIAIPSQSLDPRDRDGLSKHWPGTGNYCQNRFITCNKGGF